MATIKEHVISYVASYANLPAIQIKDEWILKNNPLKLDDTKLSFLAQSLRGYIKSINPDGNIKAIEIRKKDFTIKNLYELVVEKTKTL